MATLGEFILKYNVIINIIVTLIGAAVGYLAKNYIDKKKELLNEVNKERRDTYQKFVSLIIEIFGNVKRKKEVGSTEYLDLLLDFYKKNVLYASPEVITAFANYMQLIYQESNSDTSRELYLKRQLASLTKVFVAMRKDLGLDNRGLGDDGRILMRAIINDYDSIFNHKS